MKLLVFSITLLGVGAGAVQAAPIVCLNVTPSSSFRAFDISGGECSDEVIFSLSNPVIAKKLILESTPAEVTGWTYSKNDNGEWETNYRLGFTVLVGPDSLLPVVRSQFGVKPGSSSNQSQSQSQSQGQSQAVDTSNDPISWTPGSPAVGGSSNSGVGMPTSSADLDVPDGTPIRLPGVDTGVGGSGATDTALIPNPEASTYQLMLAAGVVLLAARGVRRYRRSV